MRRRAPPSGETSATSAPPSSADHAARHPEAEAGFGADRRRRAALRPGTTQYDPEARAGIIDDDLQAVGFDPCADSATRPCSGAARQALRRRFRTTCRTGKATTGGFAREPVFPGEIDLLAAHLRTDQEPQIVDVGGLKVALLAIGTVGGERGADDVADAAEAAVEEVDRRAANLRLAAMDFQRVERVEEAAERIVDLVCDAGGKPAEACEPLLVGEARHQRFALRDRVRHAVEAAKQPAGLGIRRRKSSLRGIGATEPSGAVSRCSARIFIGATMRRTANQPSAASSKVRAALETMSVQRTSRRSASSGEMSSSACSVPIWRSWTIERPIDEGTRLRGVDEDFREMILARREIRRQARADAGMPRIGARENMSAGVGHDRLDRLDRGIDPFRLVEDIEDLPGIAAQDRLDQRRGKAVEIGVGEIAELALLRS